MKNKQKLILGAVAVLVLVGLIGVFVFSQPTGIALNFSNNSTQQGNSSQSRKFRAVKDQEVEIL
jgi:hypothetical protein